MRRLLVVASAIFPVMIACSDLTTMPEGPRAAAEALADSTFIFWSGGTVGTGSPPPSEECPLLRETPRRQLRPRKAPDGVVAMNEDCYEPPGCSNYQAYAPPLFWGSWYVIYSHMGRKNLTVSASPIGDTALFGEVKYAIGAPGWWTTVPFGNSVSFTTGYSAADVSVHFYGSPYGTAVNGNICW